MEIDFTAAAELRRPVEPGLLHYFQLESLLLSSNDGGHWRTVEGRRKNRQV